MRALLLYIGMLVVAVILFEVIDAYGGTLSAPEYSESLPGRSAATEGKPDVLIHVLVTLTAVVALGWLLGRLFRFVGQPPVIGEVVAGIVLGPSVLGWLSPAAGEFLLPAAVAPFLSI